MYAVSKQHGFNVETFVLVIDAEGWGLRLATSDAYAFIKGMASTDSDHYPERLGNMIIINAPYVLSIAWKVIQGFLDPVTKQKVKIVSSNRAEWEPLLQKYIDIDQIPFQYGGNAPDPIPEEAISAMNPAVAEVEVSAEMLAAVMLDDDAGGEDKVQAKSEDQHELTDK
jgi:hypothetical protein